VGLLEVEQKCIEQLSGLENSLNLQRELSARVEGQISLMRQLAAIEKQREELQGQATKGLSAANSQEKAEVFESSENMNEALQKSQLREKEVLASLEIARKVQQEQVQTVKEVKRSLEQLESDLKVTEAITLEEYLAPCRSHTISYLFKEEGATVKIVPLDVTIDTYDGKRNFCENMFDLQYQQSFICYFLRELRQTFPNQRIAIYSPLGAEEHMMYTHIVLEAGVMKVQVFEPGPSNIKTWFSSAMDENEAISSAYFSEVVKRIGGLSLEHSMACLSHQIFNAKDCGRFSTIYLLNHLLKGQDPTTLCATEVFAGLQQLVSDGYERFHLSPDPLWSRPIL
jgi:hypothetical protein